MKECNDWMKWESFMPDEMYYQMRFLWDNWNEIEIIEIKMSLSKIYRVEKVKIIITVLHEIKMIIMKWNVMERKFIIRELLNEMR